MGEMAEYLLAGDDCQICGEYLGDGPGYPRTCEACEPPAAPVRHCHPGLRKRPKGAPQVQNPPYASKNEKNRAKKARQRDRARQAAAKEKGTTP